MRIEERYRAIIEYFSRTMPDPKTELNYNNPFELLVAVVLSAQCTDKRVNMVTPALFERFPTAEAMAEASVEQIFHYIRSVSFPNAKAANLLSMAQGIVERFDGQIPESVKELESLKGVGRKSANVIVSVVFNTPAMAVDTHVFRVSARIGLTKDAKNPLQTEEQLVKHFPRELLAKAHHWLILHGRYVCTARKPKCSECGIREYCALFSSEETKRKRAAAKITTERNEP